MAEKEKRDPTETTGSRSEKPEGAHDPSHDDHSHDHHHGKDTTEIYRIHSDGSAERVEKK